MNSLSNDGVIGTGDFLLCGDELRVREGVVRTSAEWTRAIACTPSDFDALRDIGVFRRVPGEAKDRHSIQFVGVLFVGSVSLVVVPKASVASLDKDADVIRDLDVSIHAALAYKRRLNVRELQDLSVDEPFLASGATGDLIGLAEELIGWTAQNGFHSSEGYGRAIREGTYDWPRTIQRGIALHGRRFVVYDNPVRRKTDRKHGALAFLQARALQLLRSMLGIASVILFRGDAHLFDEAANLESSVEARLGEAIMPEAYLSEFLRSANRDHEIELASILLSIFKASSSELKKKGCSLGMISYERVWEAGVRHVLGSFFEAFAYKDAVAPLVWPGGSSTGWLLPDFVGVVDKDSVGIFDAKWHLAANSFPSADVVKQLMYAIMLPESLTVRANVFVTPGSGDRINVVGYIEAQRKGPQMKEAQLSVALLELPWRATLLTYALRRDVPVSLDVRAFASEEWMF